MQNVHSIRIEEIAGQIEFWADSVKWTSRHRHLVGGSSLLQSLNALRERLDWMDAAIFAERAVNAQIKNVA